MYSAVNFTCVVNKRKIDFFMFDEVRVANYSRIILNFSFPRFLSKLLKSPSETKTFRNFVFLHFDASFLRVLYKYSEGFFEFRFKKTQSVENDRQNSPG